MKLVEKTLLLNRRATAVAVSYQELMLSTFGANLVAYWPAGELFGSTIADVKNAHNGTPNNIILGQMSGPSADMGKVPYFKGVSASAINLFSAGLASAFPTSTHTLCAWIRMQPGGWADTSFKGVIYPFRSTRNSLMGKNGSAGTFWWVAEATSRTKSSISDYGWIHVILERSGTTLRGYWNGVQSGADLTVSDWSTGAPTTFWLGADSVNSQAWWNGWMCHVMVIDRALTPAERTIVSTPTAALPAQSLVLFDGDSMTEGFGITDGQTYPAQTLTLLGAPWIGNNYGISGQTIVNMLADVATQIDTWIANTSYTHDVVICWGGTNDISLGVAPATVYNNISSYCSGRQTAGFKVVVVNILPRSDNTAPNEANRVTLNASLAAGWSGFANAYADIASDVRLQNPANTTYFQAGGIHLTDAGYAIVAAAVRTAILAAVA